MSKKSVGYYVWKSKFDNPYVVVYTKNDIKGESKSFPTLEELKQWVYNQDNIVVEGLYNNISGKNLNKIL
jgi:hypothetical protein